MKRLPIAALVATLAATGCATAPVAFAPPAIAGALTPAPGVVVTGRLAPADIERLRDAGVHHVIDLSADAETPDFDEAAAMRAAGLAYSNLPVDGAAGLTRDNVREFDAQLREAKPPLLVHCASGNRVGAMAALRAAWIEGKPADEAIAIGKAWGLKALEGEVRRRIESREDGPPE